MLPRFCQQRGGNRRGRAATGEPRRRRAARIFGWLLAAGAFGSPLVAFAQDAPPQPDGLLEKAVTAIVEHIIYPVVQLLGNLLITLINILVSVAQYNRFIDAVAVDKGFTIVRDVANLFFIVVLLLIAAGTVLNIPQYRYNRLLPRLILMAVLINLSKEIAGVLIDIAQVVMLTFVNSFRDAAAGNLTTAFGLNKLLQLRDLDPGAVGGYTIVGALLLALVLLVVAVFVVIAYVVILLVRIVALWVLVILSPIPYVLDTFPAGKKYASEWWDQFTKYVLCGPVIAFFLWLSLTVIAISSADQKSLSSQVTGDRGVLKTEQRQIVQPQDEGAVAATISEISQTDNLLSYLVAIVLLFMTLTMAQRFCGAAGSFAASMRQRAKRAALLAGGVTAAVATVRAGGRQIGRGWETVRTEARERVQDLYERSPLGAGIRRMREEGFLARARAQRQVRSEERQRQAAVAGARVRDFASQRVRGLNFHQEDVVRANQVDAQAAQISRMQAPQIAENLRRLRTRSSPDAEFARHALALSLATRGNAHRVYEESQGWGQNHRNVITARDIQGMFNDLVRNNSTVRDQVATAAMAANHPEYIGDEGVGRAANLTNPEFHRVRATAFGSRSRTAVYDYDPVRQLWTLNPARDMREAAADIPPGSHEAQHLNRLERIGQTTPLNRFVRDMSLGTAQYLITNVDQVHEGVAYVEPHRREFLEQLERSWPTVYQAAMQKIGATSREQFPSPMVAAPAPTTGGGPVGTGGAGRPGDTPTPGPGGPGAPGRPSGPGGTGPQRRGRRGGGPQPGAGPGQQTEGGPTPAGGRAGSAVGGAAAAAAGAVFGAAAEAAARGPSARQSASEQPRPSAGPAQAGAAPPPRSTGRESGESSVRSGSPSVQPEPPRPTEARAAPPRVTTPQEVEQLSRKADLWQRQIEQLRAKRKQALLDADLPRVQNLAEWIESRERYIQKDRELLGAEPSPLGMRATPGQMLRPLAEAVSRLTKLFSQTSFSMESALAEVRSVPRALRSIEDLVDPTVSRRAREALAGLERFLQGRAGSGTSQDRDRRVADVITMLEEMADQARQRRPERPSPADPREPRTGTDG